MKTVHAVWELENIGTDAWEIWLDAHDTPEMLAQEEQRIIAQGAEYIAVKTPPNCQQLIFGLPQMGYTFVEAVYHVAVRRDEYHMPETIARFDRGLTVEHRTEKADLDRICDIIRKGIFVSDRVSLDPAFGVLKGGNRYANWLRGLIDQGGFLYEVVKGDRPIGFFVILRKDENTVDPVLMGTLVFAGMVATLFLRHELVSLYTESAPVEALASVLLFYCAVYQIPDALQVIMSGLLRGCHDTTVITWVSLTSYWLIGFPLACILIRTDWIVPAMGPAGAWVSFIVALTIAAVFFTVRFVYTRRRVFGK